MPEFDDPVLADIRAAAEAAAHLPLSFSLEDVLAEGSARRLRRRPWGHRFGVVLVAAAILVVFFVPLPHLSLFKRLVSSPNPSPTTSGSRTLPIGTRLAELKGSDTVSGDSFGSAVAIAGNTAVVGAFDHDDHDAGRAYVFTKTTGGWEQTAELKGSDTVAGDNFGVAVGISGTTIVVGVVQPRLNFRGTGLRVHQDGVRLETGCRAVKPGHIASSHLCGDLGHYDCSWLELPQQSGVRTG